MGNREHTDYDPRIRPDLVELLGCAKEEVKIGLEELPVVLVTNLAESLALVTIRRLQAVPVEGADLPVQNLEFAGSSGCILESIGEGVG